MMTGRAKDTIVLSSGENVEPGPIEDACTASSYIQHMVLLGQDQRMLGALVVPNKEAFDELESVRGMVILTTTPFPSWSCPCWPECKHAWQPLSAGPACSSTNLTKEASVLRESHVLLSLLAKMVSELLAV